MQGSACRSRRRSRSRLTASSRPVPSRRRRARSSGPTSSPSTAPRRRSGRDHFVDPVHRARRRRRDLRPRLDLVQPQAGRVDRRQIRLEASVRLRHRRGRPSTSRTVGSGRRRQHAPHGAVEPGRPRADARQQRPAQPVGRRLAPIAACEGSSDPVSMARRTTSICARSALSTSGTSPTVVSSTAFAGQHTFEGPGNVQRPADGDRPGTATAPSGSSPSSIDNDAPAVSAGPGTTAAWGRQVAFNGSATDPGADDQSTLTYKMGLRRRIAQRHGRPVGHACLRHARTTGIMRPSRHATSGAPATPVPVT